MDDETVTKSYQSITGRLDRTYRGQACLVFMSGTSAGDRYPVGKTTIIIGRQKDIGIFIDDEEVSRKHAEVVIKKGNRIFIHDLGSKNGTYFNGRRMKSKELEDGDLIRIGGATLKYLGPNNVEQVFIDDMSNRARRDGLTGLLNKESFTIYLERSLSRCRDLSEPLSLAMMDLDLFKRVNDTYGHLAGDSVLREFGQEVNGAIRPTDLLARYGGEEFALILPHSTVSEAMCVAERLRKRIQDRAFVYEGQRVPVTISIGVTESSGEKETAETLVGRADKALYRAKGAGRNQTQSIP